MLTQAKEKSTYNTTGPEGHGMMRQTTLWCACQRVFAEVSRKSEGKKIWEVEA